MSLIMRHSASVYVQVTPVVVSSHVIKGICMPPEEKYINITMLQGPFLLHTPA